MGGSASLAQSDVARAARPQRLAALVLAAALAAAWAIARLDG